VKARGFGVPLLRLLLVVAAAAQWPGPADVTPAAAD
jgi:hypothetical protein